MPKNPVRLQPISSDVSDEEIRRSLNENLGIDENVFLRHRLAAGYNLLNACGHFGSFESDDEDGVVDPHSDFRDSLDAHVCRCEGDEVCVICCTHKDLMAYEPLLKEQSVRLHPSQHHSRDIELFMPIALAREIGLMV